MDTSPALKRTLSPLLLWGLGVGYVISGLYFGWNIGLDKGGTLGLGIATLVTIIMYVAFSFSYTELACAIPKAGGAFEYSRRALGNDIGFITGIAQVIEFVFAPPAIAIAIGTYAHLAIPSIDIKVAAIGVYLLFTAMNIYGVRLAATFELVMTILAVGELLLFAGVTMPHFQWHHFTERALPHGWYGIFAALPFAIWFFLGIEGVANVAEETINPQRNILIGFGSAIVTLVVLCVVTFTAAVGVAGWEHIVYLPDGTITDSPLPLAMSVVVPPSHWLYQVLIGIGIFGLVASFHGLILASGRATLEMGRAGYLPRRLGAIHPRFQTPAIALVANMTFGIIALMLGDTAQIITLAVFGALTIYIISMVSVMRLRRLEPQLERPFSVPLYPFAPAIALVIASVSIIALVYYNWLLAIGYFLTLAIAYGVYYLVRKR